MDDRQTTPVPDSDSGTQPPVPRRFDRVARLLGGGGLAKLARSHVAVFGLGGVGSYAVEGLARSGVGRLTLVDFDDVCITNVNRQLHAFPSTVGRAKSDLMVERVRAIDPHIVVDGYREFYDEATSERLLAGKPDVVIDAIDNVTAKIHLLATCVRRGIPVISSLGAAAKLDPTRVRVVPLADTMMDPLARVVRKYLKRRHGIECVEVEGLYAVYSDEEPVPPDPDYRSSLCGVECACPGGPNRRHSCEHRHVVHGSMVFVTAAFGLAAAAAAVRLLTGRGLSLVAEVPGLRRKRHPGSTPAPAASSG
jgi:tRNA A37 threonylcarbamoyladenosine dehydratase